MLALELDLSALSSNLSVPEFSMLSLHFSLLGRTFMMTYCLSASRELFL